jgi:predicted HicB family RNase H-like nuclease
MNNTKYGFRVIWSDADDAFIATCNDLEGVSGYGDSPGAALSEAKVAVSLLLEEYAAQKVSPPPAQEYVEHSGQFRVRLPKSLHARLVARADDEETSLNSLVLTYVAQGLGDSEGRDESCRVLIEEMSCLRSDFALSMLVAVGGTSVANSSYHDRNHLGDRS